MSELFDDEAELTEEDLARLRPSEPAPVVSAEADEEINDDEREWREWKDSVLRRRGTERPWVGEKVPIAWAFVLEWLGDGKWCERDKLAATMSIVSGMTVHSCENLLREAVRAGALEKRWVRKRDKDREQVIREVLIQEKAEFEDMDHWRRLAMSVGVKLKQFPPETFLFPHSTAPPRLYHAPLSVRLRRGGPKLWLEYPPTGGHEGGDTA